MKNQVQFITYVDRLGRGGLRDLHSLLMGPLAGLFGGVHLLPFFDPIDGADAGFDPVDHTRVDARLGTWDDLRVLAADVDVMADVIVNHISSDSPQFRDFVARGAASPFAGMFLTYDKVFPGGASEEQVLRLYRPRPGLPFTSVTLQDGTRRVLWTTFTPKQIDIDVEHPAGRAYLDLVLQTLAVNGVRQVRLDAVGYAIKRAGTACFMLPETQAFIADFAARARALGIEVLVEIHAYYRRQVEIARHVDHVYDFALPPLVLQALLFADPKPLEDWIAVRPVNSITVLDTHDGIGVIDVAADGEDREARPGLMPPAAIDALVERIHANSGGASRRATGAAASNLDLYQVNCTYLDALARDDRAYLLARAIQFFVPGVPQVYYVGLLAGENDMDLLARTGVGRDINRRYFDGAQVAEALRKPVVAALCELIRLRNAHPAFDGRFTSAAPGGHELDLRWDHGDAWARLQIDLAWKSYRLTVSDAAAAGGTREVVFAV